MKAYKVTDENMKCRDFQFELNKEYVCEGEIIPCKNGFHSCIKLSDCFNYYSFNPNNRVFEVELSGKIKNDKDKSASEKIIFIRELTWHGVLELVNSGKSNTGINNSGNWNSGNSNPGNRNSGNWNSGSRNSGDSNLGYRNSGAFCTDLNPKVWLFDKPANINVKDWENSKAYSIMSEYLINNIWVNKSEMSNEDKEKNPSFETTGGYLKSISMHEAWSNMWHNLTEENKNEFLSLPNFDADKFKIITGIDTIK